jgi:hypothetical protein
VTVKPPALFVETVVVSFVAALVTVMVALGTAE